MERFEDTPEQSLDKLLQVVVEAKWSVTGLTCKNWRVPALVSLSICIHFLEQLRGLRAPRVQHRPKHENVCDGLRLRETFDINPYTTV